MFEKIAPGWIRTNDSPLRRRGLYPLSYERISVMPCKGRLVVSGQHEPEGHYNLWLLPAVCIDPAFKSEAPGLKTRFAWFGALLFTECNLLAFLCRLKAEARRLNSLSKSRLVIFLANSSQVRVSKEYEWAKSGREANINSMKGKGYEKGKSRPTKTGAFCLLWDRASLRAREPVFSRDVIVRLLSSSCPRANQVALGSFLAALKSAPAIMGNLGKCLKPDIFGAKTLIL